MQAATAPQESASDEAPDWLSVDDYVAADEAEYRRTGSGATGAQARRNVEFIAERRGLVLRVDRRGLWRLRDRYGFFSPTGELIADVHGFSQAYQWLKERGPGMRAELQAMEIGKCVPESRRASRLRL